MKKSQLRQIIKEEISKVLSENSNSIPTLSNDELIKKGYLVNPTKEEYLDFKANTKSGDFDEEQYSKLYDRNSKEMELVDTKTGLWDSIDLVSKRAYIDDKVKKKEFDETVKYEVLLRGVFSGESQDLLSAYLETGDFKKDVSSVSQIKANYKEWKKSPEGQNEKNQIAKFD